MKFAIIATLLSLTLHANIARADMPPPAPNPFNPAPWVPAPQPAPNPYGGNQPWLRR